MKEYSSLYKDIKNGQFLPIYFFHGLEPFYIDKLSQWIEKNALSEEQKAFNQHIVYGLETKTEEVVSMAKQFPFGADRQVIIVKEAQHLDLNKEAARETLLEYVNNPQMQTLLVFAYKNKKLDGKTKLAKALNQKGALFLSDTIYDDQLPAWIETHARSLALNLDHKSSHLLADHLGNNLSSIDNELQKLKFIVGENAEITPEIIEEHIGISKDFNNFELNRAIGVKNAQKAFTILQYFEKNPKDHPMVLSIAMLYNLFSKLIKLHVNSNKTDNELLSLLQLGRNYKALNEYKSAQRHFSVKDCTRALDLLLQIDLKSKGIGTTESNKPEILREFVYQVIYQ